MTTVKRRYLALALIIALLCGTVGGMLFERYVGVGQVIDDAGLRHLVMAYRERDLGDRVPVPLAELRKGRTMVALVFGQSNAGNSGESLGSAHPGVYEYYRKRVYDARDPLLGADGNGGSIWLRLGALAVRRGAFDTVVLVPFAIGATEIRRWAPGGNLHARVLALTDEARALGLEFTHLLWLQGEADAIAGNSGTAYAEAFRAMVAALRQRGIAAPIYVARASRCGKVRSSESIRQAQEAVLERAGGVFSGPDLDTLGFGDRYDGCHFSTEGLDRAAELWLESIMAPTSNTNQ